MYHELRKRGTSALISESFIYSKRPALHYGAMPSTGLSQAAHCAVIV